MRRAVCMGGAFPRAAMQVAAFLGAARLRHGFLSQP